MPQELCTSTEDEAVAPGDKDYEPPQATSKRGRKRRAGKFSY